MQKRFFADIRKGDPVSINRRKLPFNVDSLAKISEVLLSFAQVAKHRSSRRFLRRRGFGGGVGGRSSRGSGIRWLLRRLSFADLLLERGTRGGKSCDERFRFLLRLDQLQFFRVER